MFKLLNSLRPLFRPYRRFLLSLLAVTLAASLLESLGVAAFFPVFQALLATSQEASLQAPVPIRLLLSAAGWIPLGDPILSAVALLLAVTVIKCAVVLAKDWLVARASGAIQQDLKRRLMDHFAKSSFTYFLERKQGELLYPIVTAANRAGVLAQKIPQWFAECCKVAAIGALLFVSVPWIAFFLFGLGLTYHRLTQVLSQKVSYHTGKGRVEAGAAQASIASEFLSGIRQIMAFGTQPFWLGRFDAQSDRFRNLYVQDSFWLSLPKVLLELTLVLLVFGALLLFRLLQPDLLLGYLPLTGMFALGVLKLLPSLTLQGQLRMETAGLSGDALNVQEILGCPAAPPRRGVQQAKPVRHAIVLDQVGFGYPGRPPLFQNLNLTFPSGTTTALVGPSGSGKTTLAHLVLGLLESFSGRVLVDGVDLRDLSQEGWRRRVGFVSQELFVFHGTVEENIRFGRERFGQLDVERAARIANAHPFIQSLPKGYRTVVGEKGMKLSGGQQQRIAIARAMLHDPEVLILDEATSSLDSESERLIQDALERLSVGRTVILIAHRLSTVRRADKIVVLEQGRIVEEGRHEELLRAQGRYAQLAALGQGAEPSPGGISS